jgi:hypothetical protein
MWANWRAMSLPHKQVDAVVYVPGLDDLMINFCHEGMSYRFSNTQELF